MLTSMRRAPLFAVVLLLGCHRDEPEPTSGPTLEEVRAALVEALESDLSALKNGAWPEIRKAIQDEEEINTLRNCPVKLWEDIAVMGLWSYRPKERKLMTSVDCGAGCAYIVHGRPVWGKGRKWRVEFTGYDHGNFEPRGRNGTDGPPL
jgi:hypothetical protein